MTDNLIIKLRHFVYQNNIHVDPFYIPYQSGVYALVDCVLSSQVRYPTVTHALGRLEQRLPDRPELTFSALLNDIQHLGSEEYANQVLTRHRLARRLKVEVIRDAAEFFIGHGIETKRGFQQLETDDAEALVLTGLVDLVKGIGPVLARYLLILLGREDHVKPDTLLTRLLADVAGESLSYGQPADMERIRRAVSAVAQEMGTTPARLDNALWKFESSGRKPLSWQPKMTVAQLLAGITENPLKYEDVLDYVPVGKELPE